MSPRSTRIRLGLALAACAMLAACATQPPRRQATPAIVTPLPAIPVPPTTGITPPAPADQPWAGIVASDVMQDCVDSPLIRANAAMYTRSPKHFERLLKRSLPLIIYVHEQLQAAGIPGEFTMLPMLESSYNPAEPSHRGDASGMWQMMPRTARLHGLVVNRHYDGRRDPVASTQAAIKMLKALEQRFGDWRLVDMAYNAGPYAVLGALRESPDATSTPIPNLPVSHVTHTHLARLMALGCILRQPQRYHVKLPRPAANDELAEIEVPVGTRLASAAEMAEIPEITLRALNPGYVGPRVPADSPRTLLLPARAAQVLAAALAVDASESVAQVDTPEPAAGPDNGVPLPREPAPPRDPAPAVAGKAPPARQHRVRQGETLWSIARRYHVSVSDLKRWNHLDDDVVHPGQALRVNG